MGSEDESKDTLLAKVLVNNPIAKWMVEMSTEKQERGKRPFTETIKSILILPAMLDWNRFSENDGKIYDQTLEN